MKKLILLSILATFSFSAKADRTSDAYTSYIYVVEAMEHCKVLNFSESTKLISNLETMLTLWQKGYNSPKAVLPVIMGEVDSILKTANLDQSKCMVEANNARQGNR